jgi:hypothetical protein
MVLQEINTFIELADRIAQLRKLASPQYKESAKGFYCICKMILKANENISRWFNQFAYFNFGTASEINNTKTKLNDLIADYKTKKNNNLLEMKFNCGDFYRIYEEKIKSKFGTLFARKHEIWGRIFGKKTTIENAERLFQDLGDADRGMISYIEDNYLTNLDNFIKEIENAMRENNLSKAERRRLEFKEETEEIRNQVEELNKSLGKLVMKFADMAQTPVTLVSDNDCLK